MICGHCKTQGAFVTVEHVRACSTIKQDTHSVGAPENTRYWGTRAVGAPQRRQFTENTTIEPASLAQAPVEGVFFKEGSYFKVVQSANTGNWYAKEFVDGEWEYRGRKPLHNLTVEDRVSAEDAAKFGHVTGQCVFCSRKLTDERSVTVGYGPVCAERESLPWGDDA